MQPKRNLKSAWFIEDGGRPAVCRNTLFCRIIQMTLETFKTEKIVKN